jgi:hypothetical protein
MEPLDLYLSFKTHLQQTAILLVGNDHYHVPFLSREAYSSSMATFHDEALGDLKVSLKV